MTGSILFAALLLLPAAAGAANVYYVNDTSTTGDSFTTAVGYDTNPGTAGAPWRTLTRGIGALADGDTLYIDAGTYSETIAIRDTGNLSIIGADSTLTIVNTDELYDTAFTARNLRNLHLANICFVNAYVGGWEAAAVWFDSVAASVITSDSFAGCDNGIWLTNSRDITVNACVIYGSSYYGIYSETSPSCTFTANTLHSNYLWTEAGSDSLSIAGTALRSTGIYLQSHGCTVAGTSGTSSEIVLSSADRCRITGTTGGITLNLTGSDNYIDSNVTTIVGGTNFRMNGGSGNTLYNNTAFGAGAGYGFWLTTTAYTTLLDSNCAAGKGSGGYIVQADTNTLRNCVARSNSSAGFWLASTADNNTLDGNLAEGNGTNGFSIEGTWNRLSGNRAQANLDHGYYLYGQFNTLRQNDALANSDYALYVHVNGTGNQFARNNLVTSVTRPDSGVRHDAPSVINLSRTWWGVTDSQAVRNRLHGLYATSVTYTPFRLGAADTAPGADTVAPRAPDTVAVVADGDRLQVSWGAVTASEESETATALAGYRVYRAATTDTSYWPLYLSFPAGTLSFTDSGFPGGSTRAYRVTAVDAAAPLVNESFYSDSIAAGTTVDTAGANAWYVNDAATAGDVWCSAAGDTANHGLTAAKPCARIDAVTPWLTAGDTLYIDAGTYGETVVIPVSSVWLIGADSALTVIDPPGDSATASLHGIYAQSKSGISVSRLRVVDCANGINFVAVTGGSISDARADSCGGASGFGFGLNNSSTGGSITGAAAYGCQRGLYSNGDSNTLSGNFTHGCVTGIYLNQADNNTVSGNSVRGPGTDGIYLLSSHDCTVSANTAAGPLASGIKLWAADTAVITGNTCSGAATAGIALGAGSDANLARGNECRGNGGDGIAVSIGSVANTLTGNVIRDNNGYGISIANSDNCVVVANHIDSNSGYAVYLSGTSAADTVTKNTLLPPPHNATLGVRNATASTISAVRNWWGTVDDARVRAMVSNTGGGTVDSSPYRLAAADTGTGADTVAPAAPAAVAAAVATDSSITVSWNTVVASEESETAVLLAGYRVHRARSSDSSWWVLVGAVPAGTLSFTDSGLVMDTWYYYRVTAYDAAAPWTNESWYSDSVAGAQVTAPPVISVPPAIVYLRQNDTRTLALSAVDNDTPLYLTWSVSDTDLVLCSFREGSTDYLDLNAGAAAAGSRDTVSIGVRDSGNRPDTDTVVCVISYAADADCSGRVDFEDLARMAADYGASAALAGTEADADNSGTIDAADLLALLLTWLLPLP